VSTLFDAERHEPLVKRAWNAGEAQLAIDRIVADTHSAFTAQRYWPPHPDDGPDSSRFSTFLYLGAAGVIWGLNHLALENATDNGPNYAQHLPEILTRNRQALVDAGFQTRSYLMGDAGILYTTWKITRSSALLAELADTIGRNSEDPTLELMWGTSGTMLVALTLYEQTGETRWAELFRQGAEYLDNTFVFENEHRCHLWTQNLYGNSVKLVGAVHGFAGNAFALTRGGKLLEPAQRLRLWLWIAETLRVTASTAENGANWPQSVGPPRPGRTQLLVQHCHGAPGMVTSLAGLSEPIDDLLLAAGNLTWTAGPVRKGSNLCHGTAGNGFAFLKLFERSGDEMWLDRARAFAMHAIEQSEARKAEVGRGRYSLWTGDIGLACYLWECIRATARFPTLNIL
jgi:lantibiotic modifying enzyme